MFELTKHQEEILKKLATGLISRYATVSAVESDGLAFKEVEEIHAQDKALVAEGFLVDVSSQPQFVKFVERYKEDEGRVAMVLAPTEIAKLMFQRGTSRGVN